MGSCVNVPNEVKRLIRQEVRLPEKNTAWNYQISMGLQFKSIRAFGVCISGRVILPDCGLNERCILDDAIGIK